MLTILQGDVIERLADIASDSIHCVVTSVPYFGLRDYGTATWEGGDANCDHQSNRGRQGQSGQRASRTHTQNEIYKDDCGKCGAQRIDQQIGLEKTPAEYTAKMVQVFREVRRVLRPDGTCWINIGDSYANDSKWGGRSGNKNYTSTAGGYLREKRTTGFKAKELMMMPARLAIAMSDDGWFLRQEIIWEKRNVMPESVTDRCTRNHEMIYMLSKSPRYFYDAFAIREPYAESTTKDPKDNENGQRRERNFPGQQSNGGTNLGGNRAGARNKRTVWDIPTQATSENHFACFPERLPELCILAGTSARGCCSECGAPYKRIVETTGFIQTGGSKGDKRDNRNPHAGSDMKPGVSIKETKGWQAGCYHNAPAIPCTVLDPFAGSFTTGKVALRLARKAVMIELNPAYIEIGKRKCQVTYGLGLPL